MNKFLPEDHATICHSRLKRHISTGMGEDHATICHSRLKQSYFYWNGFELPVQLSKAENLADSRNITSFSVDQNSASACVPCKTQLASIELC